MNESGLDKLLATCASEPIHIPGTIQPHGVLLAFSRHDLILVHASANLANLIGRPVAQAIGRSIEEILQHAEIDAIHAALRSEMLVAVNPLTICLGDGSPLYDGVLHHSGDLVVLELELRRSQTDFARLHHHLRFLTLRLDQAETLTSAYHVVAEDVRRLTGFERVLIYRFDANWNGQVVGEAKASDQEAFLDLRFPASDIPPQARRLYERACVRIIPDVDYRPVPLVPELNPQTGEPIDLSLATLRSVSPVHLHYLKNMGVAASMSISLMKDGALWGLITCSHREPHFVPYDLRSVCESIAQALSIRLTKLESNDGYEERLTAVGIISALKQRINELGVERGLTEGAANLLDVFSANGLAVVCERSIVRFGVTPSDDDVRTLAAWLRQRQFDKAFATDSLPKTFAAAEAFRTSGSGILAISLGGTPRRFIIWFRPEVITTIKWGGDPHRPVEVDAASNAPAPRRSFKQWQEQARLHSKPWMPWQIEAAEELRRGIVDRLQRAQLDQSHAALEVEHAKLQSLNAAKDEFLAIVSHELRSPLNVIVGYAELLRHETSGTDDFVTAIDAILRNANVQAQLIADLLDASRIIAGKLTLDPTVVSVTELVTDAAESVRFVADTKKIELRVMADQSLEGLTGDAARLKQVLWNLLSNAIKFTPNGGIVTLEARRRQLAVEFRVSDTGQGIEADFLPFVFDRFKQESAATTKRYGGLGLGLSIVRSITELHGGSVYVESAGKGFGSTFSVTIPSKAVVSDSPAETAPAIEQRPSNVEGALSGLDVLIVDDEIDARQLISTVLSRAGANARTAQNIAQGLELASASRPDVIVCDIRLGIEDGYSFVQRLRRQEQQDVRKPSPVLALTAFAGASLRKEIRNAGFQAMLAKPVLGSVLARIVAELCLP